VSVAQVTAASAPRLRRTTFTTSRLAEFCSQRELTAQTGHPITDWPLVVVKELADNGLDIAEESGLAPEIEISVSTQDGEIIVADNGPGMPAETIARILDYSTRTSSREAYVSPTRGAQGNALKTLLAMPYALDGNRGGTLIESQGVAHRIVFSVNQLRQKPQLEHDTTSSLVKTGTRITLQWPESASWILKRRTTDFYRRRRPRVQPPFVDPRELERRARSRLAGDKSAMAQVAGGARPRRTGTTWRARTAGGRLYQR
jgi:DNA topoisomerase VI subunit B